MITYIEIDGFKSFKKFKMSFAPLTVIAGANASGKSNLFDALHLLSRLAETDLKTAFNEQRGDAIELFTQHGENEYGKKISFVVEMLVDKNIRDSWGKEGTLKYTRLRYELVIVRKREENDLDSLYVFHEKLDRLRGEDKWANKYIIPDKIPNWGITKTPGGRKKPYIATDILDANKYIKITQDGKDYARLQEIPANILTQTVLSGVSKVGYLHAFATKEEMKSWKFLQLSTEVMRQPTQKNPGIRDKITQTGANLAATLFRIQQEDKQAIKKLSRKLKRLLPKLVEEVKVDNDKVNNQFIIKIKSSDGKEYTSRVLSEGTLRLLTLCVFQYDPQHQGLLCFEEPENGIYPINMGVLVQLLKDLTIDFNETEMPLRQLIINTHSPALVKEIFELENDNGVSVVLSKFNSLITTIDGKRTKLYVTRMSPVELDTDFIYQKNLFPDNTEEERKYIKAEAIRFLETGNFTNEKIFQND